jgi:hypothetical protein
MEGPEGAVGGGVRRGQECVFSFPTPNPCSGTFHLSPRLTFASFTSAVARVPSDDSFGSFQLPNQRNRRSSDGLDINAMQYGILGVPPDVTDDAIVKVYDVQILNSPEKGPLCSSVFVYSGCSPAYAVLSCRPRSRQTHRRRPLFRHPP